MYSSNELFWRNIHFVFAIPRFWCTSGKSFVFNIEVISWEWKTDSFDNVLALFGSVRQVGNFFKASSGLNGIILHVLNPDCKLERIRSLIYRKIFFKLWLRSVFLHRVTTFHQIILKSLYTAVSNGCDWCVAFGGRRANVVSAASLV